MLLLSHLLFHDRFRRWRLRAALAMFVAILIAGSIPGARAEIGMLARGLILHSVAYGVLTFLLYTGMTGARTARAWRSVLAIAAMGATDELLQSLLPYRVGALSDLGVDVTAALVVASLLWHFLPAPITELRPA